MPSPVARPAITPMPPVATGVGLPWDIDVADRSTWLLSNVRGLPETEACSWFVNTFMIGFLGSHIDKGESSAALVAKACKIAIKEWEDDVKN